MLQKDLMKYDGGNKKEKIGVCGGEGGVVGRWMMLRNRRGEMEEHVDRQQQREVGGEFILGGGMVGDYMTFVSMVMVSLSTTHREIVL